MLYEVITREIVGVNEGRPRLNGSRVKLRQGVADHGSPPLIESGFSGLDVPLPGSRVSAPDNLGKPFSLALQDSFRPEKPGFVE